MLLLHIKSSGIKDILLNFLRDPINLLFNEWTFFLEQRSQLQSSTQLSACYPHYANISPTESYRKRSFNNTHDWSRPSVQLLLMEGRLATGKIYAVVKLYISSSLCRMYVLGLRSFRKCYNTLCKIVTVSLVHRVLEVSCSLTHRAFILHRYDKGYALTKAAVAQAKRRFFNTVTHLICVNNLKKQE